MNCRAIVITLCLAVLGTQAKAQTAIKAGQDPSQRLIQKKQELTADVTGHFAKVKSTHIFAGEERWRTELDVIYTLPEGAIPTDFAYYYQGERVPAFITEKERAAEIYRAITTRQQDPALIEFIGKRTFRVRIFPVEPNTDLRMEVSWVQVAKTNKGIPSFQFPIKLNKKDPLAAVDAKVTVHAVDWMKKVQESIGLARHKSGTDEIFEFKQSAARPRSDWKFTLTPKSGVKPMTVKAATSGSDVGYAAIATSEPLKDANLSEPQRELDGGTWVTTGTYRVGKVTTVAGSVSVENEPEPNHYGLKLWAYQRIRTMQKSSRNRDKVVAMSLRHNLISKFTSWIAIPVAERKRFEQRIKEAHLAVKLQKLTAAAVAGRIKDEEIIRSVDLLREEYKKLGGKLDIWEVSGIASIFGDRIYKVQLQLLEERKRHPESFASDRRYDEFAAKFKKLNGFLGKIYQSGEPIDPYSYFEVGSDLVNTIGDPRLLKNSVFDYLSRKARYLQKDLKDRLQAMPAEIYQNEFQRVYQQMEYEGPSKKTDQRLNGIGAFGKHFGTQINWQRFEVNVEYPSYGMNAPLWFNTRLDQIPAAAKRFANALKIGESERIAMQLRDNSAFQLFYQKSEALKLNNRQSYVNNAAALKPAIRQMSARRRERVATQINDQLLTNETRGIYEIESKYPSATEFQAAMDAEEANFSKLWDTNASDLIEIWKSNRDKRLEGMLYYHYATYVNTVGEVELPKSFREDMKTSFEKRLRWFGRDWDYLNKKVATDEMWKNGYAYAYPARFKYIEALRRRKVNPSAVPPARDAFYAEAKAQSASDDFVKDRIERLRLGIEIEDLNEQPQTPEVTKIIDDLKAQRDKIIARMGDPLLAITLPEGTREAAAIFPWGETRPMVYNPVTEKWQVRFDIPPTATEGEQFITVQAVGIQGIRPMFIQERHPLKVDMTSPSLTIKIVGNRLEVADPTQEVVRVKVFNSAQRPVPLVLLSSGRWRSSQPVESLDGLRIMAIDGAHNVSHFDGDKPVKIEPTTAEARTLATTTELVGKNIQAVGYWQGIELAATLDEGLYARRGDGEWQLVPGLPSGAARQFVPWGEELVIRFGGGELVALNTYFEARPLNVLLPRTGALSISGTPDCLLVGQTGGYSLLPVKGEPQHFMDIPEIQGGTPSASLLTKSHVFLGIQGRGLFVLDRLLGVTRHIAEPQGLGDDWVTQLSRNELGELVIGTFAAGAYRDTQDGLLPVAQTAGMQITSLASGGLLGTRTGLFAWSTNNVWRLDLANVTQEVQALCEAGDYILVATRNGIVRVAKDTTKASVGSESLRR
jgi:hypothetical protein